jgi:hypothetical protein
VGNEVNLMEILEISRPFGHISHGRSWLERVHEEKKKKYGVLARVMESLCRKQIRIVAVIASPMGPVCDQSLKEWQKTSDAIAKRCENSEK